MSGIIVFSRSKEANGINEVKRVLSLYNDFTIIESTLDLFKLLLFKRVNFKSVLCLSSTDLIIFLAFQNLLKTKLKVIMAVYHPQQWSVMLDKRYSSRRAKVFLKYLQVASLDGMIFNTHEAYKSSMLLYSIDGSPNLIVAPCLTPSIGRTNFFLKKSEGVHYIATVGRLVSFKLESMFRMIEAVSSSNAEDGIKVEYHIFGNGPCEKQLIDKIALLPDPSVIKYHGYLNPEFFGSTISQFDSYFGMGYTVVHSSMLAVPSIIAVQNESDDICYGLFHCYDHFKTPMFGDKSEHALIHRIKTELVKLACMSKDELAKVGVLCKDATKPYDISFVLSEISKVCYNAPIIDCRVSVFDLIYIQLEYVFSKYKGVDVVHT